MSDHTHRVVIGGTFIFAGVCLLLWVWPALKTDFMLWMERRAIAKRKRADAKKKRDDEFWRVIGMGQETRRVPSSHIDQPRGQFRSGPEQWDRQGVHK